MDKQPKSKPELIREVEQATLTAQKVAVKAVEALGHAREVGHLIEDRVGKVAGVSLPREGSSPL
ncbi:MAG TPA: hypothetical protein VKD72_12315 [Gemmataceae bacterium]|nr:hypothetical protein [Gemmataceae bacterium]